MIQQVPLTTYQGHSTNPSGGDSNVTSSSAQSRANQASQQQPSQALQSHVMQTLAANHIQVPDNVKVEFAQDEPAHSIWINVLNANTGQVVFKFPPEAIRLMSQHNQANGLTTNVRA